MIRSLLRKLQKSFKQFGVIGTIRNAARRSVHVLRQQTPARRRERRQRQLEDQEFDQRHGVDTGGYVNLSELRIEHANWEHGFAYEAVSPSKFADTINSLAINHADFVFLDIGSGKGRALLLASKYPFQRVIGIELAPELHRVAEDNVRRYRSDSQKCKVVESVCADVLAYPIPDGPVVIYLFNPFDAELMAQVIERIKQSYEAHPRKIYVLYATPVQDELWEKADFLQKIAGAKGYYSVYKTRSES